MKFDRRQLLVSAAAAGLGAALPASAQPAAPGDSALNLYLDRLAEEILVQQPESATSYGLDTGARAALKGRLSNASLGAIQADAPWCAAQVDKLAAFPDAGLSPAARINKSVAAYAMQLGREGGAFDYGENTLSTVMDESARPYTVTQQDGAYASVAEFLDNAHKVETRADAEAYLSRMQAMAQTLAHETERVRREAGKGIILPDFLLTNTIGQQESLLATPAARSKLVTTLAHKTQQAGIAGDYAARATAMVEQQIYPALAAQLAALKGVQPRATHDAGVGRLRDGEAYYSWLLKVGTSTNLTAEEIHQVGLEQTRQIADRMDGILKANGLTQGTVGERLTALAHDPKNIFPDTDEGRAQIIAYLDGVIASTRPKLSKAFNLQLKAPVQVKRVPVDIQDGAGQGYMNPGSLDGSRPATYYINLKTTANWPRFGLPTLTFHEGIPGHAWQFAYLTETGRLPLIRTLISGFNAYVEGYALYAEQLADEIGMYDDDWAGRLGYLQGQQFRAIRLVVDTGLHAKGWGREQAIDWAVDHSGRARDGMTSEIDRYCASPGQATGYKVGHNEINRLRDKARVALGPRYDLRDFDDLLVETGSAPLTVLADVVDSYIAAGGGKLKL